MGRREISPAVKEPAIQMIVSEGRTVLPVRPAGGGVLFHRAGGAGLLAAGSEADAAQAAGAAAEQPGLLRVAAVGVGVHVLGRADG